MSTLEIMPYIYGFLVLSYVTMQVLVISVFGKHHIDHIICNI